MHILILCVVGDYVVKRPEGKCLVLYKGKETYEELFSL